MKVRISHRAIFNSPGRKARDRTVKPRISPFDLRPFGPGYRRSSNRAFVALDVMFGIIIVTAVSVILATTLSKVRATEQGLADSRSALHLAEHALLNLQHGQPMPVASDDIHLNIHRAATGSAPPGFVWAKVDASVNGHAQSLLGVVPISALPPSGGRS